jgi:hypothetical protein
MDQSATEDAFLTDLWSAYFHDPNNKDWNLSSYVKLFDIGTVKEYWHVHDSLAPRLRNGMFFFMRADCFPCWDDPANIDGGCLSVKVLKENLDAFWQAMSMKMAGETLLHADHADKYHMVNGISTSPKKYFCVVKIWLRDDSLGDKKFFDIPQLYNGDVFYKKNIDVIKSQNSMGGEPTD